MGYNIGIGEARCNVDMDDLVAYWDVEPMDGRDLGAPPDTRGSEPETYANEVWPGYIGWANFCKSVGLWEPFYGPEGGAERGASWGELPALLSARPGIFALTPLHLAAFEHARSTYRGATMEGSFMAQTTWTDTRKPDIAAWHRKRLDWLCWWTRWALENCKHPAMYNS